MMKVSLVPTAVRRRKGQAHRTLLVVLGLMVAGLFAPTSVGAEGPATSLSPDAPSAAATASQVEASPQFLGFVFPDADGIIPTKVRALGDRGVVCGTADITLMSDDSLGFYRLAVSGRGERDGCPRLGAIVDFVLLYGDIGPTVRAEPSQTAIYDPRQVRVVSLSVRAATAPGWTGGDAPPPGGGALLVWTGPDDTPVQDALALLDIDVASARHWDAAQGWQTYVPGAPSVAQTYGEVDRGDVVLVRAR